MNVIEGAAGLGQQPADFRRARHAVPRGVDAVEKVLGGWLSRHRNQEILLRAFPFRRAHPLAAMLAAAHPGDLAVGMAQHRIVLARIHFNAGLHLLGFLLLIAIEAEHVPRQPLRLPWLNVLQLLGEPGFIRRCGERFLPQQRRCLVLAVAVARRA